MSSWYSDTQTAASSTYNGSNNYIYIPNLEVSPSKKEAKPPKKEFEPAYFDPKDLWL